MTLNGVMANILHSTVELEANIIAETWLKLDPYCLPQNVGQRISSFRQRRIYSNILRDN